MARTIPEATATDFSIALTGAMIQAEAYNLDTTDADLHAYILDQAELVAQLNAEVRMLRNLMHPK